MQLRFPIAIALLAFAAPRLLTAAVTISETDSSYTLDNGLVTAEVSKTSGDLVSLRYQKLEMLDRSGVGRGNGYWSHDTSRGERLTRITIDPKQNGGTRGEVSIKGISNGRPMGNGPGGSVVADIEIRYALQEGVSGVYTYSVFSHSTNYPGTSIGEARFCAKLNDDVFDWMTVDANRNMKLITAYDWNHGTVMNMKEARRMNSGIYEGEVEHKYDYSANQFETRTWGWSSTIRKVGVWFINPTTEYLSGGPTKVELSAHRDATFNTNALNAPAAPCLLNYWRSSHYGGSIAVIGEGEAWSKVIGPFLIYCNSGSTPDRLWKEALAREEKETRAWPYNWVEGVDYPHKNQRGAAQGQLVLSDPGMPRQKMSNLLVGLTAPDYMTPASTRGGRPPGGFSFAGGGEDDTAVTNQTAVAENRSLDTTTGSSERPRLGGGFGTSTNAFGRGRRGGRGFGGGFGMPRLVDWQNDAKYYQFWVRADDKGNFTIPNVRSGNYTLHAIADGVLGEFTLTNVTIAPGQTVKLGRLEWQPIRYGKQIWDIGVANRKGSEFFKGDDYFHWGWYLEYPKLFPDDVNYMIGKSDFRKDWFFEQVPHNENPANTTGTGMGRGTTWTIHFELPATLHGKATLRLAICGVSTRRLDVSLNGDPIGEVTDLVYNATINRDGITGSWKEHDVVFDASLLKAGRNKMELTIPAGGLTSGILYDYLRLEVDESAPAPQVAQASAAATTAR